VTGGTVNDEPVTDRYGEPVINRHRCIPIYVYFNLIITLSYTRTKMNFPEIHKQLMLFVIKPWIVKYFGPAILYV
jgi:hypothetical protein